MKILAVCLGNICRSTLAQGILEHLANEHQLDWVIDSAGTSDYHLGEPPCDGSIRIAYQNRIDISQQRARQIRKQDFNKFDLILAMDTSNFNELRRMARTVSDKNKIELILNYSFPGENRSVPDSYYTGNYKEVFDLLSDACKNLVQKHK